MTLPFAGTATVQHIFEYFETVSDPDSGFDEVVCTLGAYRLRSVFQPIFSFAHSHPIGFEALVRATGPDGEPVSPPELFALATSREESTFLDRACRALHAANFKLWAPENAWLFLNVMPDVAALGRKTSPFIAEMLEEVGLSPNRVVIEILEHSIQDVGAFRDVVQYYRDIGCVMAIDDFGAGASNFDRIWEIRPDIVKLDRSISVRAVAQDFVRRSLPGLVSLLHETGALVLLEGVETRDEASVAMQSDLDMMQGYFFARPAPRGAADGCAPFFPADLLELGYLRSERPSPFEQDDMREIKSLFTRTVDALVGDTGFKGAVLPLLARQGVLRCFMLDETGRQWRDNSVSRFAVTNIDPRFDPLSDAKGATWVRRPYFQRALSRPGEMQASRPYLSLTGSHMTVTLSQAIEGPEGVRVFCCDLDWGWLSSQGADD